MGEDMIQLSLALLDTCIAVQGADSVRLLPGRAFLSVDLRNRLGTYLKDEDYVSINRKGATVRPQYKTLAGLKAFIEKKFQTQRTVPTLELVSSTVQRERSANSQGNNNGAGRKNKRGRRRGAHQGGDRTTRSRPSTKLTSVSGMLPGSKTLYTSEPDESSRPFTLIKQNYGPANGVEIDDRYYMGVVRLFGVNLPIPVGTMVWPVEIKMEQQNEEENIDDQAEYEEGPSLFHSENASNPSSSNFESAEEEFSEDLNEALDDDEMLSDGQM